MYKDKEWVFSTVTLQVNFVELMATLRKMLCLLRKEITVKMTMYAYR